MSNPELLNLPSVVPQVVMDIGLSEKAEFIDFDYDQFNEMIAQEGISDAEIERLKVHFSAESYGSRTGWLGTYKHYFKRKVTIYTGAFNRTPKLLHSENTDPEYVEDAGKNLSPSQRGNSVVRHEVGHWVNSLGARVGENQRIARSFAYYGGAIVSLAGTVIVPVLCRDPLMALVPVPAFVSLVIADSTIYAMLLGETGDVRNAPHERPAYEYEARTRDSNIVTFIPKLSEAGTITGNESVSAY